MLTPAACRRADQLPIARLVGERADRRGHDRTDIRRRLQRLDRRVEHAVHRPEMARERRRRLLADMPDARARRSAATDRSIGSARSAR